MGAYGSPELYPRDNEKKPTYDKMFIYCPKCGTQYSKVLKTCPNCGEKYNSILSEGKLFGFRSGKVWKMILSILYLGFLMLCIISVLFAKEGNLTMHDSIVSKIQSLLLVFLFGSPYVFLSEFKMRDKIPLFKERKGIFSFSGFIAVFIIFIVLLMSVDSFFSDEYKRQRENKNQSIQTSANIEEKDNISEAFELTGELSAEERKAQRLLQEAQKRFDNADLSGMMNKCDEISQKYPDTQTSQNMKYFISENLHSLYQITSESLCKEYDDNEVYADSLYKDKAIIVTGIIDSIGKDVLGDVYITLGNGEEFSLSNVHCEFKNEGEIQKAAELSKGENVRIVGKCVGMSLLSPYLQDCFFVYN